MVSKKKPPAKNLCFYLNFFYEILWVLLFNDYYGEYLMGFGVMEDLRVKMIWVAMVWLKSENFISFESFFL